MHPSEQKIILRKLKNKAGSHSPSPKEITASLGYNPIKHDFCFLSNPYATDIVVEKFFSYFSDKKHIFSMLESYPASSSYVSKHIASFEGLQAENIVVGNGAIQAIEWVCNGWDLKNLLIPIPTFSTYYELLSNRYVFSSEFWLSGNLTAKNLIELADKNKCDSILLIHPNNPTGEAMQLSELKSLVENLGNKKLIIDESFSHFLINYEEFKSYRNNLSASNVVFIKSMSKDFGIAGLRLGYLYTFDEALLNNALSKTTWNLNNFSVLFSELLNDNDFVNHYMNARVQYLNDRDDFFTKLHSIKSLNVFPSQANFFLLKFDANLLPELVFDLLIESGVYVRTMEDKVGLSNSYIRVASRRIDENKLFINAFKSLTVSY
jgi:histidinol-phosphate/aromatic aminotransferase/cobyric acid decarboxylase-like protein